MAFEIPNREVLPDSRYRQREATGEDMGAGIGRAIEAAGKTIQSVADAYQVEQSKLAHFNALTAENKFVQKEETRLVTDQDKMSPDGKDFTKNYNAKHQEEVSAFLETLPANMRPEFQARISQYSRTLNRQALQTEMQTRTSYYKSTVAEQLQGYRGGIKKQPAATDQYIKGGEDLINASGLTAPEKDQMIRNWRHVAQEDRAQEGIKTDPEATAAELGHGRLRSPGQAGTLAMIATASKEVGVDPRTAGAIAYTESGLKNVKNPKGSASGVFQLISGTAARYGGKSNDPATQIKQGVQLTADNQRELAQKIGRTPSPWEVYLAHYQGSGGAAVLLQTPGGASLRGTLDTIKPGYYNAVAAANPEVANSTTVGEFLGKVRKRFGGAYAAVGGKAEEMGAPSNDDAWNVDPKYADIPSDRRSALADQAYREADKQDTAQQYEETSLHVDLAKTARTEGVDAIVKGTLDPEWVTARQDDLSPEDADRFAKIGMRMEDAAANAPDAAEGGDAAGAATVPGGALQPPAQLPERSEPAYALEATRAARMAATDPDKAHDLILDGGADGRLSLDDTQRLLKTASEIQQKGPPPSWYSYVSQQFPAHYPEDGLGGNSKKSSILSAGGLEFENWVDQNPNATQEEAQKKADAIQAAVHSTLYTQIYSKIQPMFLSVPLKDAGPADIQKSIDRTMKAWKNNEITMEQARDQATKLRAWNIFLSQGQRKAG
jgi:hypothetical protein